MVWRCRQSWSHLYLLCFLAVGLLLTVEELTGDCPLSAFTPIACVHVHSETPSSHASAELSCPLERLMAQLLPYGISLLIISPLL